MFTTGAQEAVAAALTARPRLRAASEKVVTAADRILKLPHLQRTQEGRRLLAVSREGLRRILFLSYACRMSGRSCYLERAREEMLTLAGFADWNPSHFLDVAEMTTGLALGYDWLHAQLDEKARATIGDAIIDKGLRASLEADRWKESNSNWNQVCNGGMVLGALAVYEHAPKLAEHSIDRARQSVPTALAAYDPDGAYPEGPSYWQYGTTYHVLLLDSMRSVFGDLSGFEITPGFLASPEYLLHVRGPRGYFNYGDSHTRTRLIPALFWFAAETRMTHILLHERAALERFLSTDDQDDESAKRICTRFFPFLVIWGCRTQDEPAAAPTTLSWKGEGITPVAFHRSGWGSEDIFVGIKGGTASSHHAHMDAGSFVMDAHGVRWVMDLGGHDYHRLESAGVRLWDEQKDRWSIKRYSNLLHNTLTVDGNLQQIDARAEIVDHTAGETVSGTTVDLTDVYRGQLESAVRTIRLGDRKYVSITDELKNNGRKSTVRWAMLTHEDIEISGTRAVIRKDGKSLTVEVVAPRGACPRTWSTDPQTDFEDKNPGTVLLGFEAGLEAWQAGTIEVRLIP